MKKVTILAVSEVLV